VVGGGQPLEDAGRPVLLVAVVLGDLEDLGAADARFVSGGVMTSVMWLRSGPLGVDLSL
jgi:hypothetical protein